MIGMATKVAKKTTKQERDDQVRIVVTPAFKAWLQDYASSRQLTMTDTIVQDLIEGAARRGFKAAPKR